MSPRGPALLTAWLAAALALAACQLPADATDAGGTMSPSSSGTSTGPPMPVTSTTSSPAPQHEPPADSTDGGFILHPDAHGVGSRCDLFAQDCRPGEKCTPWASDGGTAWNATRCVPIADDPAAPGEPCTVLESATSGLDDCDQYSMCWFLDERLQGECVQLCLETEKAPACPPDTTCTVSGGGVLTMCLPTCDPLAQDCGRDRACYPFPAGFGCAPDASGRTGVHGAPCRYINACDPGYFCVAADAFTDCQSGLGCCSLVCDHTDPLADDACVALDPGQSCEAWFLEGMAPTGYENVGVCALPL